MVAAWLHRCGYAEIDEALAEIARTTHSANAVNEQFALMNATLKRLHDVIELLR